MKIEYPQLSHQELAIDKWKCPIGGVGGWGGREEPSGGFRVFSWGIFSSSPVVWHPFCAKHAKVGFCVHAYESEPHAHGVALQRV